MFSEMRLNLSVLFIGAVVGFTAPAEAQLVPGTGNLLNYDDLEDPNWGYVHNFPKSSKEEDETIRYPLGASTNKMWSESPKRGSPDTIKRVETPAGGLAGSTGSLYMRTRDTGIPGRPGFKQAQDDFVLAARPVSVGYSPNFVVRVYLPEFSAWEQRQGVSFGIRAGLQGMMTKQKPASFGRRLLRGSRMETVTEVEPYYPGFFIAYNPVKANSNFKEDYAQILIRSDGNGNEVAGPKITQTGWWTFGMSVTPDSRCHYYAHPGVADLTATDHIYSSLPYGIRGDFFNTIFFNVCSADNGQSWSTPWIIDDPKVYYSGQPMFKQNPAQQAQKQEPVKTAQAPASVPNTSNASLSKELPTAPSEGTDPEMQAPVAPPSDAAGIVPDAATSAPASTQTSPLPVPTPESPASSTPDGLAPAAPSSPMEAIATPPALQATEAPVSLTPVQPSTTPSPAVEKTDEPITPPAANPFEADRIINSTPKDPVQSTGAEAAVPSPPAVSDPPQVPVTEEPPLEAPILEEGVDNDDPSPVPAPPAE